MFILSTISDTIRITPEEFSKKSAQALEDNINDKYADKVIHEVGLCICLYDIVKASEGLIGHGTGIVSVTVEFRLLVFRPFKGEILAGTINDTDSKGIHVHLDFFNDIYIPCPTSIFEGSRFDESEQLWIWTGEEGEFYYDRLDRVHVRVEKEEWHDLSPSKPTARGQEVVDTRCPYRIYASMAEDGLGPSYWWEPEEGAEEVAEDAVADAGEDAAEGAEEDADDGELESYEIELAS